MIVAVTGGSGFIGKRLVSQLIVRGHKVRLLTRQAAILGFESPNIEIFNYDLAAASIEELKDFVDGVSVLYHCAGQLGNASLMHALHVDATHLLAEAAIGRIARWVQLSSVGVYGSIYSGLVTEEASHSPCGEYESTKSLSELLVKKVAKKGGFEYVVLRPSNVYGPGMTNRSLYGLIAVIQKKLFFFIGKRGASANYVHVDNVVKGLLLCGSLPQAAGRAYNLTDYCEIEKFIGVIARRLGVTQPKVRVPKSLVMIFVRLLAFFPAAPLSSSRVRALTGRARYSCEKIEHELGYRHLVSMEEGLSELVDYWQACESYGLASK